MRGAWGRGDSKDRARVLHRPVVYLLTALIRWTLFNADVDANAKEEEEEACGWFMQARSHSWLRTSWNEPRHPGVNIFAAWCERVQFVAT